MGSTIKKPIYFIKKYNLLIESDQKRFIDEFIDDFIVRLDPAYSYKKSVMEAEKRLLTILNKVPYEDCWVSSNSLPGVGTTVKLAKTLKINNSLIEAGTEGYVTMLPKYKNCVCINIDGNIGWVNSNHVKINKTIATLTKAHKINNKLYLKGTEGAIVYTNNSIQVLFPSFNEEAWFSKKNILVKEGLDDKLLSVFHKKIKNLSKKLE